MTTKVFTGATVREIIPEVTSDTAKLITPVHDDIKSKAILGHLLVFKGLSYDYRNDKYLCKALTENQSRSGIIGSFSFIGTNPDIFNHLFNNRISGKFTKDHVIIDRDYSGLVSFEFVHILQNYIIRYKDK